MKLTPEQRKLVEAPNLAHFVTLMKDGSPQVTPVWVHCDDEYILVNTAQGRQKPLNLARDPRVARSARAGSPPRDRGATHAPGRAREEAVARRGPDPRSHPRRRPGPGAGQAPGLEDTRRCHQPERLHELVDVGVELSLIHISEPTRH